MFTINGYSFGNIPNIRSCVGEETIWYVMSLGATYDVHTASFDGNAFTYKETHRDTKPLVPGSTAALRMMVDNPGRWIFESHSNLAKTMGMYGFYKAEVCNGRSPSPAPPAAPRKVREWYIGADEVEWDYAPKERSIINNIDLNDPRAESNIFVRDDDDFIGDVYKKAIYREYTDGTFTKHVQRSESYLHMDILGPAIRAEVGDVIKVHFKNLASRNYSIHSHGVRYSESDSGVNYVSDQEVCPGETKTYTWEIPERSGPGPNDPNCIPWMYSSAVDPVKDTTAGLVGVVIICKPGILKPGGMRSDVNREFVVLMSVMNENISPYIADNVKNHAPNRMGTDYKDDPDFEESNIMHAINGRLHGNSQAMNIKYNHSVAWYFAALGTDVDLHSFHLHGHTVLHSSAGHRDDALNIFPGQVESMEMIADNPGTWLLHCNSLDHISAGMQTTYSVLEPPPPAPEPSPSKTK
jgi:FtsP/CotA-like multicopper oxidase with cupredoxin domain